MGYTQPLFNVRKVAGGYNIYPEGVATDDLTIYPNPTDTLPNIKINGTAGIALDVNTEVSFSYSGTVRGYISYASPDVIFYTAANKNLFLSPLGTGLVKFGVRTATGDAASNGYITILDAAGNTVKLMTTA